MDKRGIPFSIEEAELVVKQPMDQYHREILQWLIKELKTAKMAQRG